MRSMLRPALAGLALAAALPCAAHAQFRLAGGLLETTRSVAQRGESLDAAALFRAEGARSGLLFAQRSQLDPSGNAYAFSAGVYRTGALPIEAAVSWLRGTPEDFDETDTFGGELKVGLPFPSLAATGTSLALAGEGAVTLDEFNSYGVGLLIDQVILPQAQLGAQLAYGGVDPEEGDGESAFIPTGSLTVIPAEGTELRAQYTADNDLDGEDSFRVSIAQRFRLERAPQIQAIAAIAKHGTVTLGVTILP